MQSSEFIYRKMASLEQNGAGKLQEATCKLDSPSQMPRSVVHELNNLLGIIQGYADCLLLKYQEDETLQKQLRLIFESAVRAAVLLREMAPPVKRDANRQSSPARIPVSD